MSRGSGERFFRRSFLEASRYRACASPAHASHHSKPRPSAVATFFRRAAAEKIFACQGHVKVPPQGISHKKAQKSQKEVFKSLCVSCASLWPFLSVATLTHPCGPDISISAAAVVSHILLALGGVEMMRKRLSGAGAGAAALLFAVGAGLAQQR